MNRAFQVQFEAFLQHRYLEPKFGVQWVHFQGFPETAHRLLEPVLFFVLEGVLVGRQQLRRNRPPPTFAHGPLWRPESCGYRAPDTAIAASLVTSSHVPSLDVRLARVRLPRPRSIAAL